MNGAPAASRRVVAGWGHDADARELLASTGQEESGLDQLARHAGADVLDHFLTVIREHAQKHDPRKLPPESKGPLAYLLEAKKRA